MNYPLLTKILQSAEGSPYKWEHSDQNHVGCCNSPSAIVHCYQRPYLVRKLDKIYRRKEPEKFETIAINWFESVFKITSCVNCFEKSLGLLPITGFFRFSGKTNPKPHAPSCLPAVAHVPPPPVSAPGSSLHHRPLALVSPLLPAPLPVSRVPPSVSRTLAFPNAAGARALPVSLPCPVP